VEVREKVRGRDFRKDFVVLFGIFKGKKKCPTIGETPV